MKKYYLIISFLAAVFLCACSNTENDLVDVDPTTSVKKENVINSISESDGVRYTLKDLSINPELVNLTNENVKLESSKSDLEKGIYILNELSPDVAGKIAIGNTLYLRTDGTAHLRKITNVEKVNENSFVLATELGELADLFESGSIEFDVDVAKVQELKSAEIMTPDPSNTKLGVGINFDILKYIKEYKADGMTFNPNTSVSAVLHFKITFDRNLSLLPLSFEVSYEIKPSINPYFEFLKVTNKKYKTDLLANIPDDIIKLLGKIEVDMDVPAGSFGTFPAKISINQLHMPLSVLATTSKEGRLEYNVNGTLKVGYEHYNPILHRRSGFIYENSIISQRQASAEFSGEVISDLYLVIEPKVSLVDLSLFDVKGNISVGVEAITAAKINTATNQKIFASQGVAKALGTFDVYFRGNKFLTTDVLNESINLWSVGNLDKSIKLSNLNMVKPSILPCKLNSFSYTMSMDYKYFVDHKIAPGPVTLTYDVYDDRGRSLKSNEKLVLNEWQVAYNKFNLNLCIPFRFDPLAITTGGLRPSSYIRNMTFTDSYGYKGVMPDFEVGSPHNKNFWR